jgi:hypothetical protein
LLLLRPVLIALVVMAYFLGDSCCRSSRSPWSFAEEDAAAPEVQRLLRLVERPGRTDQGFAPLPTAGSISVGRNRWFRSPPPGWEGVSVSLHIQTRARNSAWYFAKRADRFEFLWETETFHSGHSVKSATINNGKPFSESVELEYVARTFSGLREGYRVRHDGASGREMISLAEARALVETWERDDRPSREKGRGG